MDQAMMTTDDLGNFLPKIAQGKVRDLFRIDEETLLFVATDRISAYDVTMSNGIPHKGRLLTLLSAHWFALLTRAIPNLRTHFLTLALPPAIPPALRGPLQHRAMHVRKHAVFPIEAIVRGYLTGSAWSEYRAAGTVHGMPQPAGLVESQPFPAGPLYTPSTKAGPGECDENIHPERAAALVGTAHAARIEDLARRLYAVASAYAWERGIIIADTKFEFGLDEASGEVVLVDEVLTPDSSRFWDRATYVVGRAQESFDKQFLRDWLVCEGVKGKKGVTMSEEVVRRTGEKYVRAFEMITGTRWEDVGS